MSEEIKPVCDHRYAALEQTFLGSLKCTDCGEVMQMPRRQRTGSTTRQPGVPVQVTHAPIHTANWQITSDMVRRYNTHDQSVYDPCIICGVRFLDCPHDHRETEVVWTMIKNMPNTERYRILNGK